MSEVKDVIVGLWKNNSARFSCWYVSSAGGHLDRHQRPSGWVWPPPVLTLTNLTISSLRRWTPAEIRIPIYVMIIASVVSVVQMLINAYAFGLYQSLGIFIPLIVTNCIVVGRAEAFAAKKGRRCRRWTFLDRHGRYLRDVCAGLPARILATAPCLTAPTVCCSWAKVLRIEVFHTDTPFLLAMLPPGLWPRHDAGD